MDDSTSRAIKMARSMLPAFKEYNKADFWYKRMKHEMTPDGRYLGAAERYQKSVVLPIHLELFKTLAKRARPLRDGETMPILAFGAPVRDWKTKEFGKKRFRWTTIKGMRIRVRIYSFDVRQ
jgi:hypothetical protein